MRSLQQLLSQAHSSGCYDSEGVFTIDGKAAVGKLAFFQLPRSTAWLLKVVQAAVASGADSLKIRQLRKETTFTFAPTKPFEIEELQGALTRSMGRENSAVGHLAVGLRAVAFSQNRDFALCCQSGGEVHLLSCSEGRLARQATETDVDTRLVQLAVSNVGPGAGICASRAILEEHRELAWVCQASPIEVSCDKLRLDTLARYQDITSQVTRSPLAVIWRAYREGALLALGFPKALHVGPSGWRPTDRFSDKRTFHVDGPEDIERVSFLARLSFGARKAARVHWISRGVICSSQELEIEPLGVQLDLFLNADSLETDLSGLKFLPTSERNHRMAEGVRQCSESLEGTLEALANHVDVPLDLDLVGQGSFLFVHGLILAIGFKGLTLPFHLSFARTAYREKRAEKAKIRKDCIEQLELLREKLSEWSPQNC